MNTNPVNVTTISHKNFKAYGILGSITSIVAGVGVGTVVKKATDSTITAVAAGTGTAVLIGESMACANVRKAIYEDAKANGYRIVECKTPLFGKVVVREEHD